MANEHDLTVAALKSAIQLEIDGKEYYLKMSAGSGNAMGKNYFNLWPRRRTCTAKNLKDI